MNEKFLEIWRDYKKMILTGAGLFLLLLFMLFLAKSCSESALEKEVENLKVNANVRAQEAANIHANLKDHQIRTDANLMLLNQQALNQQVYVNSLVDALNVSKTAREEAQRETNAVLENVRKAEEANYTNTNMSDAQKARCLAFPERCR